MSKWGQTFGELLQQQSAALLPLVTLISAAGILLCSIAVVAIIIERSVILRRRRVMPDGFLAQIRRLWYRGDIDAALECCDTQNATIARIIRADRGVCSVCRQVGLVNDGPVTFWLES